MALIREIVADQHAAVEMDIVVNRAKEDHENAAWRGKYAWKEMASKPGFGTMPCSVSTAQSFRVYDTMGNYTEESILAGENATIELSKEDAVWLNSTDAPFVTLRGKFLPSPSGSKIQGSKLEGAFYLTPCGDVEVVKTASRVRDINAYAANRQTAVERLQKNQAELGAKLAARQAEAGKAIAKQTAAAKA